MDAYLAARYTSSWFDGTVAGGLITNPGTAAVPTITVVGSGDIDLTIGARTIHITGLASSITIDCDTGQSANGTTDLTSTVTFDYYPWTIPAGAIAGILDRYGDQRKHCTALEVYLMGQLYVYDPWPTAVDTMGLCGPLTPTKTKGNDGQKRRV